MANDALLRSRPRPVPSTESATPAPAIIEVENLVKTYDGVRVVDDLGFGVADGEIFGILGANGAGKTTTVECLQGLRRPDGGRLRILGLDPIADRDRVRSVIGSQLQACALPDRLRVGEAVALFDRTHFIDAPAHLEPWGLADACATPFADLSGGQKQRLFIVLALLNNPKVLFLDELTQGLDPAARRDVWHVIRSVRDRGATIVLVSHLAEEIEALCDRVAVMKDGRITDTGSPRDLVDRHATHTAVSFTPPPGFDPDAVRRLPGVDRVEPHDGRCRVTGTSEMVAPVCAATLDDTRAGPPDLHVTYPGLDDALINLIGTKR